MSSLRWKCAGRVTGRSTAALETNRMLDKMRVRINRHYQEIMERDNYNENENREEKMNIDGVKNGIVLDHIKAGKSMMVYELLGLDKVDNCVAVIQNVSSSKYGKKDIIKIDESIELDLDVLGYIDSNITVNHVKDGKLEKKLHLELPLTLKNVVRCKNPRCITSIEQEIVHTFRLVDREKKVYRCAYCDAEHRVK